MTTSATITSLWRYPVKSMQGEQVQETEIDASGIAGDRRLALRDVESNTILSAKKAAVADSLLSWSARIDDDDVMVEIDGESLSFVSQRKEIDARCSALLGRDVTLVEREPGAQAMYSTEWPDLDGLVLSGVDVDLPLAMSTEAPTFVDLAALHLITAQSLRSIAAMTPDTEMPVERFRPSMVIDLNDTEDGFIENAWQGRRARIGEVELNFTMLTPRCVVTARAQPMCDEDLEVLRSLITNNRVEVEALASNSACLGIYAEITSPGVVAVGDRFELIDGDR
jgi:uncharacterized protein YcbX